MKLLSSANATRTRNGVVRHSGGSIVLLMVMTISFLVVAVLFLSKGALYWLGYQSAQGATEAAVLAASNELAAIVVDDPHFGFVGLSNWPAGKMTLNRAGEPVPVLGINTILATLRTNLLIAKKVGNKNMVRLALKDVEKAKDTCRLLKAACSESLKKSPSVVPRDRDGNEVLALKQAKRAFELNMNSWGGQFSLDRFELSCGWIEGGGSSCCALPLPVAFAELSEQGKFGQEYNAFTDVPVDKVNFYFAGLAPHTSLVSSQKFQNPDNKRFCSAIKLSSSISFRDQYLPALVLNLVACAVPGANPDLASPPLMVLSFPHGRVQGMGSLEDLLKCESLGRQKVTIMQSVGGDYPDDPSSRLQVRCSDISPDDSTADAVVAKGVYDWLRSCHARVRLDSAFEALSKDFPRPETGVAQCLAYRLDGGGNIEILNNIQYSKQTVHDEQDYVLSHQTDAWGRTWTFSYRNAVSRLGVGSGKHRGLPLREHMATNARDELYVRNGLAVAMEFSSPL